MKTYFTACYLIDLNSKDTGVLSSIVRVHPSRMDATKSDPSRLFRRQAVQLVNTENGLKTIRFCLGAGALKIAHPNTIAVDYDTKDMLGISSERTVKIKVNRAGLWSVLWYFCNHPDMAYRLSTQMAVLGTALGVVGLVLGILSLR